MKYTSVEELRDKLREAIQFAEEEELSFALIFKTDVLSGGVEHRLIFSDSNTECRVWLDTNIELLNNLAVPYSAHLSGQFYGSRGDLFYMPLINE